ncbi:MAG: hypothetical protein AAFP89_14200 [Bacteroidota bacterium]
MNAIFKKMNYKDQVRILVLHAHEAFEDAIADMQAITQVDRSIDETHVYTYALIFTKMEADLHAVIPQIQDRLAEDAILYFAYPKKSSKKYKSDINRDSGAWKPLGELGYEGVRMVAIDADWSALRFRQASKIKSMTRRNSMALSEEGKERTKK